jgi:STE24 endopeptidase
MTKTTTTAINPWRMFKSDPKDWYTAEQVAKADEYVKPARRMGRIRAALSLVVTLVLIGSHITPRLLNQWHVTNWFLRLALAILIVTVVDTIVSTPFSAWRELSYDKKWGFSTQTVKGFIADMVKAAPIGVALTLLLFAPLWAVIRATDLWWVLGWAVFAFIQVSLGILFPIVIFPLFNKYTPLEEGELRTAILETAARVGADINEVLVEDSSKRDTRPNAYVAGIGRVRRVVLFDTILRYPKDAVLSVIAHEIGHWKMRHILRTIPTVLAMSFVGFVAMKFLLESQLALDFAGVDSLRDPAMFPLFQFVFIGIVMPVTGLVSAWLSRGHERQADIFGLDTIGHPDDLVGFFRDVSVENLADLHPSRWRQLRQSHPPFAERMAMASAWGAERAGAAAGGSASPAREPAPTATQ